jgi:uncharacterized repeat protein (TIGR01451 family)
MLSNTATISSDLFDPTPADHSSTTTTTVSGITSPATLFATKTVTGNFDPGGRITYTIVLHNSGPDTQLDNPGPELQDILTVGLTSVSVSVTSGTYQFGPVNGTLLWNGSIPAGGSVEITIQATIPSDFPRGVVIFNQALFFYDADGDGTNESVGATDDPSVGGPTYADQHYAVLHSSTLSDWRSSTLSDLASSVRWPSSPQPSSPILPPALTGEEGEIRSKMGSGALSLPSGREGGWEREGWE